LAAWLGWFAVAAGCFIIIIIIIIIMRNQSIDRSINRPDEYLFDTAWHSTPQPLEGWFEDYASRRYGGQKSAQATAAWKLLGSTVYQVR